MLKRPCEKALLGAAFQIPSAGKGVSFPSSCTATALIYSLDFCVVGLLKPVCTVRDAAWQKVLTMGRVKGESAGFKRAAAAKLVSTLKKLQQWCSRK